jgi:aspartyl-tRNA(Asn)/glutamyl-tRNA(Gln) amidotransferase subunit A
VSVSVRSYQSGLADYRAGQRGVTDEVTTLLAAAHAGQDLRAFVEVYDAEALELAQAAEARWQAGEARPLEGLAISVKDMIAQQGHGLQAASRILYGYVSPYSSTALGRLLDAGAIPIGRVNCDEFGMGSSNENTMYGRVCHPQNPELVAGGSSGGSAVSVAIGACHVSLGTDTGGSVRLPASFCGLYGLKPTYGRISRYGVVAYGSSFDQIGLIGSSAQDLALCLRHMAGHDPHDDTSATEPVADYPAIVNSPPGRPLRLAYVEEAIFSEGLDPEIKAGILDLFDRLKAQGHTVEPVRLSLLDYLVPIYYILTTAEASSNLARYDGIRFGYRSPSATDLYEVYVRSRSEGFGREVKRRIMLGTFVLSAGYYDAYYTQAQKVRRLIHDQTRSLLATYDFLLSPTSVGTAFRSGEKQEDPVAMYLNDIYTVQANLAGIPALSIPYGTHSNGLPWGVQAMAPAFAEGPLLRFGAYLTTLRP